MEMTVTFPGGLRVDAAFGDHVVHTDQSLKGGGEGSAPTPFMLFLSSIATCAGVYVLGFCRQRELPTDGIRLVQRLDVDPGTGMVRTVHLDIHVPADFPAKYRDALIRSARQCTVKKHLDAPPEFAIQTLVDA